MSATMNEWHLLYSKQQLLSRILKSARVAPHEASWERLHFITSSLLKDGMVFLVSGLHHAHLAWFGLFLSCIPCINAVCFFRLRCVACTPLPLLFVGVRFPQLPPGTAGLGSARESFQSGAQGGSGSAAIAAQVAAAAPVKRRKWYLGIQSKKDPAHVMTEVRN